MRFVTMVVVGIGLGSGVLAQAGGQEQGAWTEARSLRELPAGIQALLGVGLGLAGIADRDGDFNETDAIDDITPRRRFVLGIVNGGTALVALEQGGRVYSVRAIEFKQAGTTWDAVRCVPLDTVPRRSTELVGALAGKHAGSCGGVGIRTDDADAAPTVAAPVLPVRVRQRPGA
ncbi:hypothetical protein NX786_09420 [Telluria mixta]|uniref:Uncharacterized protein n=1 Tax=Telluria mixta TaxID=34071 RepID=A0ABT2BX84_9BURK|nr:hypothetical protein [Telluria mixta]MCS0629552.1 hypothetical protein [Telluria mixta]WEM96874.1 hypothetical protein P0M04_03795 [Telluria mixta]